MKNSGAGESIRLNELYPDRFVPTTVHGDGKLWHSSDKGFLENWQKTFYLTIFMLISTAVAE